jgi:DNA-binding response OmpR family regulator
MAIKVLLGCSEKEFAKLLRLLLEEKGFQFQIALTSEECVRIGDDFCPNIVIFDDSMLGKEFVKIIQRTREQLNVPILVLSSSNSSRAIAALEAGADDYIIKPVHADLLISRLRSIVRRYSQ